MLKNKQYDSFNIQMQVIRSLDFMHALKRSNYTVYDSRLFSILLMFINS